MHDVCVHVYREAFPGVEVPEAEAWLPQQGEDRYSSDGFGGDEGDH